MPYSQDDPHDPCGKDRRSAGRKFLPRNPFFMLILGCRIPAYSISFDFLLCCLLFLTLKKILTQSTSSVFIKFMISQIISIEEGWLFPF